MKHNKFQMKHIEFQMKHSKFQMKHSKFHIPGVPGDSTADLLYQHEQEGYRDHPYAEYPYGDHRDYGGYPGEEEGYHPGDHLQHPGLHEGDYPPQFMGHYREQEEDYDYYQQVSDCA